MIKITSELKQNAGFTSKVSVLELTSYTMNETVVLVQNTTMPSPSVGSKNITVLGSLYKSATDKAAGATSFTAVDFPYSFSIQATAEDVVNEAFLYTAVSAKLTDLGYTNEIV